MNEARIAWQLELVLDRPFCRSRSKWRPPAWGMKRARPINDGAGRSGETVGVV